MQTGKIGIRISGGDLTPERLRASELADILTAVESAVAETVVQEHKSFRKEQVIIGLVEIQAGSIGLQFEPQTPELAVPAWSKVTDAVEREDYTALSSEALDALDNMLRFTQRHNCIVEMGRWDEQMIVYSSLTPDTQIIRKAPLEGETIVYGQLLRVGGRNPRFMFQPVGSEHVIYGDVSENLARQLASRLYEVIGVQGEARWDPDTLELKAFNIKSLVEYENPPLTDAFNKLEGLCGQYFDDIDNPDEYVRDLRSDDLED